MNNPTKLLVSSLSNNYIKRCIILYSFFKKRKEFCNYFAKNGKGTLHRRSLCILRIKPEQNNGKNGEDMNEYGG